MRKWGFPVTTLNFFDDDTHCTVYSLNKLKKIISKYNLTILKAGKINEPIKLVFSPILILLGWLIKDSNIVTGSLWTIFKWSNFIVASKN